MNAAAHLVLVVADSAWPAVQAIAHACRQPGGLARIHLYQAPESRGSTDLGRRLERFVREVFPETPVDRVAGPLEPGPAREQFRAWMHSHPQAAWTFAFAGIGHPASWLGESLLATPGSRVLFSGSDRAWFELRRTADAESTATEVAAVPDLRRDVADDLPLPPVVRTLLPDDVPDADLRFAPAPHGALPVTAITEAVLGQPWRWADAFRAAGAEIPFPSNEILFERYLGGLLVALGIRPATRRLHGRSRAESSAPAGGGAELWIQQGGRVVVLDLDLAEDAHETGEDSALTAALARLVDQRRLTAAMGIEWVLVRPRQKLGTAAALLARALGVQVLDQAACHALPSRLALVFGVPLSPEGAEIERRLQGWLTQTGRTRVFGDEPSVLRASTPTGAGEEGDPLWTRADALVERVMAERGQNWLLWTHRGRAFLRVPAGGRPAAAQEWRLLALVTSGLDDREVSGRPTPDGAAVLLEFPESPSPCRRLSAWLQPFANRSVTFQEAQARFAAQARVDAEANLAQSVNGPKPVPAPAPASAAAASRPAPPSPRPKPPAPKRPPQPSPPPRPRQNPLADLDRALDDALGG